MSITILWTLLQFLGVFYEKSNASVHKDVGSTFKIMRGVGTSVKVEDVEKEEDLEYPGSNPTLLKKIERLWENYYECLRTVATEERKPEIIQLIEGQYTQFECNLCSRPFEGYSGAEWKYKPLSSEEFFLEPELLDLPSEMFINENKTLKIFNAIESFSGLYACYLKKNVLNIYILEVLKNGTLEKADSPFLRNEIVSVAGISLQIYYSWIPWTECNSCGRVGKTFKYGFCYVTLKNFTRGLDLKDDVMKNMQKNAESSFEANNFLKKISIVKDFLKPKNSTISIHENFQWVEDLINKFKTGIPCASQILPIPILELTEKYAAVKAVVKLCSVPCEEFQIFEVLDSAGNVVETANNSAGIYSIFQNLPHLPPEIERRSIGPEFGTDIILQCPGTQLTTVPFIWKINNKEVFPELVANQSSGRFTIDLVNRIHLQKLRLRDSHIYSCWQRDKLVGTINLKVQKKLKLGYDHHITLVAMVAVIGTFLMVGSKILARELRNRKK